MVQEALEIWIYSMSKQFGEGIKEMNAYDGKAGVVLVKIDTTDKHGCVSRGCRDDDLLGTALQVGRSPKVGS